MTFCCGWGVDAVFGEHNFLVGFIMFRFFICRSWLSSTNCTAVMYSECKQSSIFVSLLLLSLFLLWDPVQSGVILWRRKPVKQEPNVVKYIDEWTYLFGEIGFCSWEIFLTDKIGRLYSRVMYIFKAAWRVVVNPTLADEDRLVTFPGWSQCFFVSFSSFTL